MFDPAAGPQVDNPVAWRGGVERFIGESHQRHDEAERRLDATNGSLEKVWIAISDLRVALGRLAVKVAVAAGVASLVGSGVVSFVVLKYASK